MPAFEAEVGMPYWIDLTTSDADASARFYTEVLGWEAEEGAEGAGYRLMRIQGLPVAGLIPQPEDSKTPDTWVTYFLSRNVDEDLAKAEKLGGRTLAKPQQVDHGLMALCADPTGGLFGLIEPSGPDKFIAAGEPGTAVWHELSVTRDFQQALDFYGELFNWELRTVEGTGEGFEYATAEEDGAAFAGFWNAAGRFPEGVGSFWQTFLGVRDADAAAQKALELGGQLIQEPMESPFGRLTVVADSTGATVTLVEVEDAPEEDPRESDDLFGLELPEDN
ncbi:glyoxalase [Corynebacterium phocae]|uniref:Glyoxalase n=1 Tax=Corynebacterium phocae TaxID=161895 RepID=A0A1L7D0V4_9CORY|nr:VOC family protein [Corynebacterium phocae]APT91662.1 glyoxalase [Corynebacterium phocae]KAA8728637.1 VOC family protein [Corynebacterium phocae]